MQEFIITTPDQLKSVIVEAIKAELDRQLQKLAPADAPNNPKDNFLTRIEAAKILGISLPTLNTWTKAGIVKGHRIGACVRYKLTDLEQALIAVRTSKDYSPLKNRRA